MRDALWLVVGFALGCAGSSPKVHSATPEEPLPGPLAGVEYQFSPSEAKRETREEPTPTLKPTRATTRGRTPELTMRAKKR